MSKISKLSDKNNHAASATLLEVLELCTSDLSADDKYNKMIVLMLNDRNGEYQIQPYPAGFVHNSEVVALLEIAKDIFKFSMGTFEIDE